MLQRNLSTALDVPVLIPAYKPTEPLTAVVRELLDRGVRHIIVVNDGSGPDFRERFRSIDLPGVSILEHAINLGKGAALKTGMNYALVKFPECPGVVTADADGQHHPGDIIRVAERLAEEHESLVLGVRSFRADVPLRSRLGNDITRFMMRIIMGQNLADTQTGLRGVPATLIPHLLRLTSAGYEFELDMLITCKHISCPIAQVPIQTIYIEGNKSSHFRPVLDSMRIYFLLLRFSVLSILSALVDYLVFWLVWRQFASIGRAQATARVVSVAFNYFAVRRVVFHSRQRHAIVMPRYLALAVANALLSYAGIKFLNLSLGLPPIAAKVAVELPLFIANFAIQRDFVFTRRKA